MSYLTLLSICEVKMNKAFVLVSCNACLTFQMALILTYSLIRKYSPGNTLQSYSI